MVVIDASAAVRWFLPDEATEQDDRLLAVVQERGARAPSLWPSEVANALLVCQRRRRIEAPDVFAACHALDRLAVKLASPFTWDELTDVLRLADGEGLTAYDAEYLELALSSRLPLATWVQPLARAARQRGVQLFFEDPA